MRWDIRTPSSSSLWLWRALHYQPHHPLPQGISRGTNTSPSCIPLAHRCRSQIRACSTLSVDFVVSSSMRSLLSASHDSALQVPQRMCEHMLTKLWEDSSSATCSSVMSDSSTKKSTTTTFSVLQSTNLIGTLLSFLPVKCFSQIISCNPREEARGCGFVTLRGKTFLSNWLVEAIGSGIECIFYWRGRREMTLSLDEFLRRFSRRRYAAALSVGEGEERCDTDAIASWE